MKSVLLLLVVASISVAACGQRAEGCSAAFADEGGEKKDNEKKDNEKKDAEKKDGEKKDEKKKPELPPPPPSEFLNVPADATDKARAAFDEAVKLYTRAAEGGWTKPTITAALRAMEKASKALPTFAYPHVYMGRLHLAGGAAQEARKSFTKAVEMVPGFWDAHIGLGDAVLMDGDRTTALAHYERARELHPFYPAAVFRTMQTLVELRRFDEAQALYDKTDAMPEDEYRQRMRMVIRIATEDPDWGETFTHESANYIVKTNISQSYAQEMADAAELIREVYDRTFPDIPKPDRKYRVLIFKTREQYLAAGGPPPSGGVYVTMARVLMLFYTKQEETLMTLKHEGFHQYCHEYLEFIPSWFNEGLADYFSASKLVTVDKKRAMQIIPNHLRLGYLKQVLDSKRDIPTLPELMSMTQAEMYEPNNMYLHYCQGWALVYFCIEGGKPAYRDALRGYFKALTKGKDQQECYRSTFGKLQMKTFENEWYGFVRKIASEQGN